MILKTNLLGVQQTLHKRKVKQSTPKMVAMNIINTVIASLAVVVFSVGVVGMETVEVLMTSSMTSSLQQGRISMV